MEYSPYPKTELRNGTLDLAIEHFPDARSLAPSFLMESLSEERNVVIARRGQLAFLRKLTLERLTKLDHAAVIYRNEPWGLIDNELAARGLRRRLSSSAPGLPFGTACCSCKRSDCLYPGNRL